MNCNLKKIKIICFLLFLFSLRVSAPSAISLTVLEPAPIEPYMHLVFAVEMVETKGDTLAYNPLEEAVGILQIRPIRLIDYNKRTGSSLTREDLFNYEISEQIFLYFADQIGPYNLELIARKWNGSGHLTSNYWERVRLFL
jgi:hypothetical protein